MANSNAQAAARKSAPGNIAKKPKEVMHSKWVKALERFGYVARGVLFLIIGFLAFQASQNKPGGDLTDQNGAMARLAAEPFGQILLGLMVLGLIGFAIWGLVRAIFDPLGRGSDRKGMIARLGYLISAVSYGALAIPFAQVVLGGGRGPTKSQTQTTQDITAQVLGNPLGAILIAAVGAAVILWALAQLYTAYTGKFAADFKTSEMSAQVKRGFMLAGRLGIAARAIVFALIGFFLIQAALHVDSKQAVGLDGALWKLTQEPQGALLLGAVALGLMFFGLYSILSARWVAVD